jgi:ABC-type branched-subunit amino acid transport system substrate-binding protein
LTILIFIFGIPLAVFSQQRGQIEFDPNADAIFENAVILYNNGKYAEAYEAFSKLLGQNRWHQRLTATLLMRAKTSYLLKNYKATEEDLKELAKVFPKSRYIEHAQVLMGLVHFQKQDLASATRNFLLTVDFAKDPKIRKNGETVSKILLRDYLNLETIERLQGLINRPNASALLVMAIARKYLMAENVEKARILIDDFMEKNPNTAYQNELLDLLKDDSFARARALKLGVVLPLTGELAQEGQAVYRGIRYAQRLRQEKNSAQLRLEVVVKDSESRMIKAVTEMHRLISDKNVIAVIGELDAMITAGLAGIAQAADVPFVAPVTSDNGLASIGDNIFQFIPDYEIQARAIAKFAIDSLRFQKFVTLAPQDEYGRQMVDAFSAEIDRLGGEIITQSWYYSVPENLSRQFKLIRELAFRRNLEDTLKLQIANFSSLDKDSLWRAFNLRMMLENKLDEPMVDLSSHFPVRNIDGIFLPIYSEDVKYVARQLSYYNINAQLLGGEKWYHEAFLKDRDLMRYIEGTIFASSYFIDPANLNYRAFRDQFRIAVGVTPEKWELIGFDALNLLFGIVAEGASDRISLQQRLGNDAYFKGVRGEIQFSNDNRVNNTVYLLQIQNSRFRRIDGFKP